MADFLIIGGMKCGTTSLYDYLSAHQQIDMISVKELNFFNNMQNYAKGRGWYEQHFANDGRLRGDVNPNYAMFPLCKGVPARISEWYPSIKLVYAVREPLSRLTSHIQHNMADGKENRDVETICADLESGKDPFNYVGNSRYFMQLSQFTTCFPLSNIHVIESSELRADRDRVMSDLIKFLGLAPYEDVTSYAHTAHESSRKRSYPRFIRQAFKSNRLGGLAGKTVQATKRLLPETIYETLRGAVSKAVMPVSLTVTQKRRLTHLINSDAQQFYNLIGRRLWPLD